jgi:hypothetical protein
MSARAASGDCVRPTTSNPTRATRRSAASSQSGNGSSMTAARSVSGSVESRLPLSRSLSSPFISNFERTRASNRLPSRAEGPDAAHRNIVGTAFSNASHPNGQEHVVRGVVPSWSSDRRGALLGSADAARRWPQPKTEARGGDSGKPPSLRADPERRHSSDGRPRLERSAARYGTK